MIEAADAARARSLTLRYVLASTAILLASGLLGVLMRGSQADPAGSTTTPSTP